MVALPSREISVNINILLEYANMKMKLLENYIALIYFTLLRRQ